MQQSNVWHSLRQEGGVPELLRSRTRTRRKRRKRSWGAPWAYLLPLLPSCGTFSTSPALVSLAILSHRRYGRPAERLCLIACSH
jgi:hypothetical protein